MDELSRIYGALADPTRRGIVARLGAGEATVAALREPLTISAPAVSKHLRVLEEARVIERRRAGRHQVCKLRSEALMGARTWLDDLEFWSGTLDSLAAHLAKQPPASP